MILKIRIPTDTKTCGWRLIDRVKKVDYEFVDETDLLKKNAEAAGIIYIDKHKTIIDSPEVKKVAVICFEIENDFHEMFYTDDMVYIMNDNGKTCDTINV